MTATADPTTAAVCRVCGCTTDDACIMQQGDFLGGCWWVEDDLCSGCTGEHERVRGPLRDHRVTPAEGEGGRGDDE
jgi:hypothetical protein